MINQLNELIAQVEAEIQKYNVMIKAGKFDKQMLVLDRNAFCGELIGYENALLIIKGKGKKCRIG